MVRIGVFEPCSRLLVVVLGLVLISSAFAQCTPSTCPDGTVLAVFEYANCTGSYEFYSFIPEVACSGGSKITVSETEIVYYYNINNDACDETLANASFSGNGYRFGVCGRVYTKKRDAKDDFSEKFNLASYIGVSESEMLKRNGAMVSAGLTPYQGIMVLKNVNSSFSASPQPYLQYNPAIPNVDDIGGSTSCYSGNNCTLPQGGQAPYYETSYSDYNCAGSSVSSMYPDYHFDGYCYNYNNDSYMAYSCADPHTLFVSNYFGDSCNVPALSFSFTRSVCSANSQESLICLAPPPSNPVTQPSSATTLNLAHAALLVLFCLIASLISFF